MKDETLFALKGPGLGAFEAHFLSSATADLTQAQWDAISPGMICLDAVAFGDLKKEIEELCSVAVGPFQSQVCVYQSSVNVLLNRIRILSKDARAHR